MCCDGSLPSRATARERPPARWAGRAATTTSAPRPRPVSSRSGSNNGGRQRQTRETAEGLRVLRLRFPVFHTAGGSRGEAGGKAGQGGNGKYGQTEGRKHGPVDRERSGGNRGARQTGRRKGTRSGRTRKEKAKEAECGAWRFFAYLCPAHQGAHYPAL